MKHLYLLSIISGGLYVTYKIIRKLFIENPQAHSTDMTGKTCIVTGTTSGLGEGTVMGLMERNANVVMANRSERKSKVLLEKLKKMYPKYSGKLLFIKCDLSDFDSVVKFVKDFKSKNLSLDVLICNAGLSPSKHSIDKYGYEFSFTVNHLGHFILINGLLDNLVKSKGRLINISSRGHWSFDEKDLDIERFAHCPKKDFGVNKQYGFGKLCNILSANYVNENYKKDGVTAMSLCPGFVFTNFAEDFPFYIRILFNAIGSLFARSPYNGAQISVHLACMPNIKQYGGKFIYGFKIGNMNEKLCTKENAEKLWKYSVKETLKYDQKIQTKK